ncbi:hypothetical protein [Arthrobacter rhombi]|uniref:hypothetical protein n=1 Tax=Arthrobacter rhombi TaxID=71253 RepID=UPI003FD3E2B9
MDSEIIEEDPLVYFPEKLEFRSAYYDAAMDSVQQLMDATLGRSLLQIRPAGLAG